MVGHRFADIRIAFEAILGNRPIKISHEIPSIYGDACASLRREGIGFMFARVEPSREILPTATQPASNAVIPPHFERSPSGPRWLPQASERRPFAGRARGMPEVHLRSPATGRPLGKKVW
jgi:hypothetical protein